MGNLSKWAGAMALLMGAGMAQAATQQPTEEQVRQLMEVVGVGKMMSQMNAQAVTVMQQSLPCVPSTYWQTYVDASGTQQFIGRLVPIWQKHFTADEMEGMLKFYRSPLGQKVIAEMPTTMAEANQAGLQWSHERSEAMIAELKQKGSLDAQGRCPAVKSTAGGDEAGDVEANEDEAAGVAAAATKATPKKATSTKAKSHTTTKPKTPAKAPAKTSTKSTSGKATTKPAASGTKASGSASTTATKPATDKAAAKPASAPASGS